MSRIHYYVHAGSLALCVKHLLIQLIIDERVFSLSLLNDRLGSFNFGCTERKNWPSKITSHHLSSESMLKQSGECIHSPFPVCFHVHVQCTCTLSLAVSQMWCLGRFLPILIGDLVPEEHCYWENFLTLLDIVNELFAPVTTTDRADYVSLLVEVFLGGFKE